MFFKSILYKNWRGGGEFIVIEKCTTDIVTPANHVIARAGFTFSGASGTVLYVKSAPGYCIAFIKRLGEVHREQLSG